MCDIGNMNRQYGLSHMSLVKSYNSTLVSLITARCLRRPFSVEYSIYFMYFPLNDDYEGVYVDAYR